MENDKRSLPGKIFSVDFAGIRVISDEDSYTGKNLLDAEDVGEEQAKVNGEHIAKRYNMHNEAMDIILAFIRESKSNTATVKKATELLNRNKE